MKKLFAGLGLKILSYLIEKFLTEERIEENKDKLLDMVESLIDKSGNEIDNALVQPIIDVLR